MSKIKNTKKMNILIVVPWDQEFGGVASVVGNLATYLSEKKHTVLFLHPGPRNIFTKEKTKWGFSGYKLSMRKPLLNKRPIRSLLAFLAFFPVTFIQIMYILLRHKVDIVNIHYPEADFFYFALCRKLLGIKLITSIHGADFFPAGMPMEHVSIGIRFILSASDGIVAPSNSFLNDFLMLFPDLQRKGHFIHSCVNMVEMNHIPEQHVGTDENRYLLCIAAQNEKKGIDVLIRSFSNIAMDDSSIYLFLVGDGPLRSEHEKLVHDLGIQNRVRFFGNRGRTDVVNLLRRCELLILPSRAEPFGIVTIEAMLCRKPVVATMVGGIPEIVENGVSGILVEPDNPASLMKAICRILDDDVLKTSIVSNGYSRVCSNFLCKHTGAKYETLFHKLLLS